MTRPVVVIAAAGAAAPLPPAPFMPTTPLPVDAVGHRYLPDHGRPLPAGIARVLTQVPLDASASAFTFTVLRLSGRGGKPPQRNTTGAGLGARQPRRPRRRARGNSHPRTSPPPEAYAQKLASARTLASLSG